MSQPEPSSANSPEPSRTPSPTAAPRPDKPRFGDLVQVELIGTLYYGIVDRVFYGGATVWLGNGLGSAFQDHEMTVLPMHPGSPCHANFAEILRWGDPTFDPDFAAPGSSGTGARMVIANAAGAASGSPGDVPSRPSSDTSTPSPESTETADPDPTTNPTPTTRA